MTQVFKKIDKEATEKFVDELLGYSYRLFEPHADASPKRNRKAQSPRTYRYHPCPERQLRATEISERCTPQITRNRASFSITSTTAEPQELIQDESSDSGISGNPSEADDLVSISEKESNPTENNSNADESMEENEDELNWANHFNKEIEVSVDDVEEDGPVRTPESGHWETLGKIIVFHQECRASTLLTQNVPIEAICEKNDPVEVPQLTNNSDSNIAQDKPT